MRKKALRKDFYMEIRKSWGRFLSLFFIVAIGVAFFSGIRSAEPDMRLSGDAYFDNKNLMDIQVLSTIGLTEADVDALEDVDGVEAAEGGYSLDALCKEGDSEKVVHIFSMQPTMNQVTVEEGRMPESPDECLVDADFLETSEYKIGDKITLKSGSDTEITEQLKSDTFTIVGSASSPFYISFQRGSSSIGTGSVSGFVAVLEDSFRMDVYTEIYIKAEGAEALTAFTDEYENRIEEVKNQIEAVKEERQEEVDQQIGEISEVKWYINDRGSLAEYDGYGENADRMRAIGQVFPVLFFLVAALISLTTMTRMVEEQRTQIGTMKALGYSRYAIAGKYIGYAFLATIGGCIFGILIGEKILPYIIINAYGILYVHMDTILVPYNLYYGVYATVAALFSTILATLFSCFKELREQPAELMRPPAPKQGKRVLLERIPFIWRRFSFIWKATVRNLVRYKKRFFMAVFGIGGCMALLLVGFGLKDSIFDIGRIQYHQLQLYDASIILNTDAELEEREALIKELESDSRVAESAISLLSQVTVENKGTKQDVYLNVPQDLSEFSQLVVLRNRVTKQEYALKDDEVILTEKAAKMLDVQIGDRIVIQDDTKGNLEVEITDICENYMGHYIYMTPALYEKIYGEEPEYNSICFKMKENQIDALEEVGETALGGSGALNISYTGTIEMQLDDMLGSLNIVLVVLVISAGMLAFVVLYNLNSINITERRRELATIKVLGFYDNEVSAYVYRENIILTLIGSAAGMILGKILHQFVIVTVEIESAMFGRNIDISSFVYSFLITMAFSVFVNLVMHFKLKKIDMVESLKSVE